MITNTAVLAALTVLVLVGWLAGELDFLAPYRSLLFHRHGVTIGVGILLLFLNLFSVYYSIARLLFLRDSGRKLTHVDRQLTSPDTVLEELRSHVQS